MVAKIDNLAHTFIACFIGTAGGAIGFIALLTIYNALRPTGPLEAEIATTLGMIVPAWLVSFIPTVIVGFPLALGLQRLRITGYLPTVAIFALCGAGLMSLIGIGISSLTYGAAPDMSAAFAGSGALMGFLTASLAWLFRRPDLDNRPDISPPAS